jgi:hypothetical protein
MNNLTLAQMAWLRKHPKYSPHRRAPSRGSFHQVGSLHADGTSEPLGPPTNLIKLRPDGMSIGAGIRMASRHRGNRFFGLPAQPPSTPRRQIEPRSIDG